MKVLILVMSARRDPWGKLMAAQMETWDAVEHPQTTTRYYVGRSFQAEIESNVWQSKTLTESLEDVSPRTIEAFEKSLELEWDYMARCHSSTYVHKRNLVDFIETLPKEDVLCGLLTTGEKPYLWGGGSYILSRDVVEKLVAAKDRWNRGIMEDGSLTDLARELGIPFTPGRMASINQAGASWLVMSYGMGVNFTFKDWKDINLYNHPHYYYRVKQDLERHKDIEIMRLLKDHLP